MAAAVGSEDEFHCCICLGLFNNPVTTPCGHTFCKICINNHWDLSYPRTCPLCKETFYIQPDLKTNTLVAEMVARIRNSQKDQAGEGDVSCDVCAEPKLKAVKSCLDCAASFCPKHLEPHMTLVKMKTHDLIGPVQNLKDRMCSKHGDPLRHFCRTDQSFICAVCKRSDHKKHLVVSLKEELEQRRPSLDDTEKTYQHMLKERRVTVQRIKTCLANCQTVGERERSLGEKAFTALVQFVLSSQDEFFQHLKEKQQQTQKHGQDLIEKLEREISELEKTIQEVQQQDHFHLLHHRTVLSFPDDLYNMRFRPEIVNVRVTQALVELKESFSEFTNKLVLEVAKQFECDVTLDPDTAHCSLALSEDRRHVYHMDTMRKLPDSPLRFTDSPGVLGKESFSRRFYFEVDVGGKSEWDIGVALETVNRNGDVNLNPDNGYWSFALRGGNKFYACTGDRLTLRSPPQKVGVFVDYQNGLVSFFDAYTAADIHSFKNCHFPQKLLPFFSPGNNYRGTNSSPLVLSAGENLANPPKKQKRELERHCISQSKRCVFLFFFLTKPRTK